jgi:hypothetical protein
MGIDILLSRINSSSKNSSMNFSFPEGRRRCDSDYGFGGVIPSSFAIIVKTLFRYFTIRVMGSRGSSPRCAAISDVLSRIVDVSSATPNDVNLQFLSISPPLDQEGAVPFNQGVTERAKSLPPESTLPSITRLILERLSGGQPSARLDPLQVEAARGHTARL